eukprot:403339453
MDQHSNHFYENSATNIAPIQQHSMSITNRSQEVIRWSDTIAQIARQTDRNLSKLDAYENSRDQSAIYNFNNQTHNYNANYSTIQNHQTNFQQQNRPPINPSKLKFVKPLKIHKNLAQQQNHPHLNILAKSLESPSINNYFRYPNHNNTTTNQHLQTSSIFSFGGNSPSVHLRNQNAEVSQLGQNHGVRSMTPTQKQSMIQKLDFYGRRNRFENNSTSPDKYHSINVQNSANIGQSISHIRNPSDLVIHQTPISQQMHDTIELELRSHLDMAKNDLTTISKDIHSKLQQEVNKYPQLASEESEVNRAVKDLQNKFGIFEDEIIRRTKDLIRSYKVLKQDNNTLQKRISECVSIKEVEMKTDIVRSEVDEQLNKCKDDVGMLQNQFKAQRFEIEGNIMKKIKLKQSEEERKVEDFYKFKADVYQYLDSKVENLQSIYANKFKTVFEFTERADEKIRVLWDQKNTNDFNFDDFKSKQAQKLNLIEDQVKGTDNKCVLIEGKIRDHQTYLTKLKKIVQSMQQDRNIAQRVEVLEKRLSDEDIQNLIGLQVDLAITDKLFNYQQDNDALISKIEKELQLLKTQNTSNDNILKNKIEQLQTRLKQNLTDDFSLKLQAHTDQIQKLKLNFDESQTQQEKTFLSSFNDIKQIILAKIIEIEKKGVLSEQKIFQIEQSVIDVGLKYEHFQELFTNLIQEMQTTENDEEASVETNNIMPQPFINEINEEQYQHYQMNNTIQLNRVQQEQILHQDNGEEVKIQNFQQLQQIRQVKRNKRQNFVQQQDAITIEEGELLIFEQSKDNTPSKKSIAKQQLNEKKLFSTASPSRNKNQNSQNFTQANSSLPLFMKSHIQKQSNKIYIENSPERKAHDNLLISQKFRQKGSFVNAFTEEANIIEKAKSQQMMKLDQFNEIWIAKQEKQIKAYTPKFQENQVKIIKDSKKYTKVVKKGHQTYYEMTGFTEDQKTIANEFNQMLDDEILSNDFLDSSSSQSNLKLLDKSMINKQAPSQSRASSKTPTNQIQQQHQEFKQRGGVINYGNLKNASNIIKQQKSFRSLMSESEENQSYEYSENEDEDKDEEIYPFDQSPRDNIQIGQSPLKQHVSVIETSSFMQTSMKKENPLEMLLKTTAKLNKDFNERNSTSQKNQQSQSSSQRNNMESTSQKVNPLIDDEENSNRNSLTPLTSKLNFNDEGQGNNYNIFEMMSHTPYNHSVKQRRMLQDQVSTEQTNQVISQSQASSAQKYHQLFNQSTKPNTVNNSDQKQMSNNTQQNNLSQNITHKTTEQLLLSNNKTFGNNLGQGRNLMGQKLQNMNSQEMNDICEEVCAWFIAHEMNGMLRNTIRRKPN